jgi:hypothetical protein
VNDFRFTISPLICGATIAASPAVGPPATAQARTQEAAQATGIVGAPALIRPPVSISRVLSTSSAATATSAQISHWVRPRGVAYAITVIAVHADVTASATNPGAGWA